MTVLKFGFTVMAKTRDEVLEEIDALVREFMSRMTGEPWVTAEDSVRKIMTSVDITNPDGHVYLANREVIFAGPHVLNDMPLWRDGFRPQDRRDFPF